MSPTAGLIPQDGTVSRRTECCSEFARRCGDACEWLSAPTCWALPKRQKPPRWVALVAAQFRPPCANALPATVQFPRPGHVRSTFATANV